MQRAPSGRSEVTWRHTVSCYRCGTQVTDISCLRSVLRRSLQKLGWVVAIPMWAAGLGRRGDPAIARKTVDICNACLWALKVEAMEGLERYNEEQQFAGAERWRVQ